MRIASPRISRHIAIARDTYYRASNGRRHFYRAINVDAISFLPRDAKRRGEHARHKKPSLVRKTLRPWIVTAWVSKYTKWTLQNVIRRRWHCSISLDIVGYWKINDIYSRIRLSNGIFSIMRRPIPFHVLFLREKASLLQRHQYTTSVVDIRFKCI